MRQGERPLVTLPCDDCGVGVIRLKPAMPGPITLCGGCRNKRKKKQYQERCVRERRRCPQCRGFMTRTAKTCRGCSSKEAAKHMREVHINTSPARADCYPLRNDDTMDYDPQRAAFIDALLARRRNGAGPTVSAVLVSTPEVAG